MKRLHRFLILCAAGGVLAGWAWYVPAEDNATNRAGDEQAIRQSAEMFAMAYNAGNAKTIASQFVADGEYIDEFKNIFKGREAIEKEMAAYFKQSPGNKIAIQVDSVRFIGPSMAIEEGHTTLDLADDGPAVDSRYIAVHSKQDGKWQIAVARDLEAEALSPHERLRELSWLIGDWVDESDDATVNTLNRWSEDGNYILGDFQMHVQGIRAMNGTQRLGWDPVSKQIRSWIFDSEGGFVEGAWTRVGDQWIVKLNGVRPDGAIGSATNIYAPVDDKTIVWSSTQRVVGGELQPDATVTMVRQPPQAAAAK